MLLEKNLGENDKNFIRFTLHLASSHREEGLPMLN